MMNQALQKHTNDSKQHIIILENHMQKLQNSFRDNVILSQNKQSSLSNKVRTLETLLNALLGASTLHKLQRQQQVEEDVEESKGEKGSAASPSSIDFTSHAFALINQPIHGHQVMVNEQQHVLQQCEFDSNNTNNDSTSFRKSIDFLNKISHLHLSTPPDYFNKNNK